MSKMGLTGLKSRCQQGYAPSGSSRGESVPCLLQFVEATCISRPMIPFHLHRQ